MSTPSYLWDSVISPSHIQGPPRTVIGQARLSLTQATREFMMFHVLAVTSWPPTESCYNWELLCPDNLLRREVVILSHQQCWEIGELLGHDNMAVQVAVISHEVAHGIVNHLLPWQTGAGLRQVAGVYRDEDMTWAVARKVFEVLPQDLQVLCSPAAWEAVRCFALGGYWQNCRSRGEVHERLPYSVRKVVLEQSELLWAGGVSAY